MASNFSAEEKGTTVGESEYTKGTNTSPFYAAKQTKTMVPEWPEHVLLPQPMDESFITRNGSERNPWSWSKTQRLTWYRRRLIDNYGEVVKYHAEMQGIPPRLLAVIILNELADISEDDVWQDKISADASWLAIHGFDIMSASIGISQIQISTVERDHLLNVNQSDYEPIADFGSIPIWAFQAAIARKLTIPYWAILATSKEIKNIIDRMIENKNSEWQSQFNFTYPPVLSEYTYEIYNCINLTDYEVEFLDLQGISYDKLREAKTANLIHAAYNSPDIIIAQNPGEALGIGENIDQEPKVYNDEPYSNGRIIGFNAMRLAYELFDMSALV